MSGQDGQSLAVRRKGSGAGKGVWLGKGYSHFRKVFHRGEEDSDLLATRTWWSETWNLRRVWIGRGR